MKRSRAEIKLHVFNICKTFCMVQYIYLVVFVELQECRRLAGGYPAVNSHVVPHKCINVLYKQRFFFQKLIE